LSNLGTTGFFSILLVAHDLRCGEWDAAKATIGDGL
jgi:hypothetical protein